MTETSLFKLTITFNDPELDSEQLDKQAQQLIKDLKNADNIDIERIGPVPDPHPPEGNKAIGGLLAGILMAEMNADNAKKVFNYFSDRLSGKPIEFSVEGNGKKLTVKAANREDLEAAIKMAQEFIG